MQNSQNKKTLQIVLLVLVAVLTISIGYASITAINLIINGNATASVNQNNFIVHFIEAKNITGTTGVGGTSIIDSDDTKASFNVTGLSKVGDYAEAKYVVKNDSNGIGAEITLELTNSNSEYFKVTETIDDNILQAGDTTLATVKVEMIKTPIDSDVSTSVTATLTASPLENASATGGESVIVGPIPDPVSFSTDSWATIRKAVQDNNTSLYNVGDTKEVNINGNNYTVRLVNKTTGEHCGDNDTSYSQTACGFVVEFADIITIMKMKNENTVAGLVGGYPATLVYDYLKNTLYDQLPVAMQTAIKPTRVISGYSKDSTDSANFTTTDKLYLLSGVEIHGADSYDTASSTTTQLDYYKGMAGEIVGCDYYSGCTYVQYTRSIKQYQGSDQGYWLRSPRSKDYVSFRSILAVGALNDTGIGSLNGVAPAFRIG